jgi:heat shock protein HtpX
VLAPLTIEPAATLDARDVRDGTAELLRATGAEGGSDACRLRSARRSVSMIDGRARRRYKIRNAGQAVLLLGGMVVLLAALAWLIFGLRGLLVVLVFGAVAGALRPEVPSRWVLSAYGARPLPQAVAPQLHRYVRALAERAGLPAAPSLYYVASPMANAFAVGRRDDSALAVTDGILRLLSGREMVGVLAHEISHIRADDMWVMSLSDTLGRITHGLAYLAVILLFLSLPFTMGGAFSPLWFAVILTVLPTVVTLLQLGLSRSREYDADLEAVMLTGDPNGLASALEQLERSEGRLWERVMVPRRRAPDPLLLRTHPPTAERTRRLRALGPRDGREQLGDERRVFPATYPRVESPARLRFPGVRW